MAVRREVRESIGGEDRDGGHIGEAEQGEAREAERSLQVWFGSGVHDSPLNLGVGVRGEDLG